jgi:hypothetical protein
MLTAGARCSSGHRCAVSLSLTLGAILMRNMDKVKAIIHFPQMLLDVEDRRA